MEKQVLDLKDQLGKATDPEAISKIIQNLKINEADKIIQNHIQENEVALSEVVEKIEKTTDKASCDKIKVKYNQLIKKDFALKGNLSEWSEVSLGGYNCSEKGWTAPYNPSVDPFKESSEEDQRTEQIEDQIEEQIEELIQEDQG